MKSLMTKYSFLVYHREYDAFLESLRDLGVLHVEERQSGFPEQDSQVQVLVRQSASYKDVLVEMKKTMGAQEPSVSTSGTDAELLLEAYAGFNKKQASLMQQQQALVRDEEALEPWGNIDWATIQKLENAGFRIAFYSATDLKQEDKDQYNAFEVGQNGAHVLYMTMTPAGMSVDLLAEQVMVPHKDLVQVRAELQQVKHALEVIDEEKTQFCIRHYKDIEEAEQHLQEHINFETVKLSGAPEAENKLYLLEGWCPNENVRQLNQMLENNGVWYSSRKATREDNAPIKFKNNAFNRMYEVLTKMYGMPEYGEFDPTPIVAPFFTLFFAFCMGDAGYGLVLIALGLYLKKKIDPKMKGMMNLVITLGIATTVFGAILGTFFGVSLVNIELPERIKQFMIVGKVGDTSYDKQMLLALIIGVVHISLAMFIKAVGSTVRYGFLESLSIWGWLLLVVGFVCTGGMQYFEVISAGVSQWAFILIGGVSAIGIYLLNNIHRNVFINIGAGLWDTYNMATGLMGDVLSYIRLYALGLAGAMLGGVFNQLAFMVQDAASGVPGWVFCGLILIFGHMLNIAMSCLSAFVHPLRLTFVEYFKNSGYEGKGVEYKPFTRRINK